MKNIRTLELPTDIQVAFLKKQKKKKKKTNKQTNKKKKQTNYKAYLTVRFWKCDIIERVHLKFLKYSFNLEKWTPSYTISRTRHISDYN